MACFVAKKLVADMVEPLVVFGISNFYFVLEHVVVRELHIWVERVTGTHKSYY